MQQHRDLAAFLVSDLLKRGADACDVYVASSDSFNTTVRLGNIEKLQQSNSTGLGMRVFKDGATAMTYTTDFQPDTISELASQTLQIVSATSPDPHNGLAPQELLGQYEGELRLFDESLAEISPEQKIAMAREMEDVGRSYDNRITNSNGASWSNAISQVTLANSDGFVGQYQTTRASMSLALLAEQDGVKQRDYWFTFNRYFSGLDSPSSVGTEAARRVIARLGGRKIPSCSVPVVLDPMIASQFVGMIFGAASGDSIYRRASYLVDKVGQKIASPSVSIVDDATLRDGPASRPFDGEGIRSSQVEVIQDGVLMTYVCDSYSARRLESPITGNAGRQYASGPSVSASNLFLKPGQIDPEDIIGSVQNGLLLTEMFGSGVNAVTGDFSQGASGFWIEDGEIAYPVQEITIAGNVLKVLQSVEAIGNDLNFKRGSTASPTLLISEMTVGGQ